jgi:hypothetical protein
LVEWFVLERANAQQHLENLETKTARYLISRDKQSPGIAILKPQDCFVVAVSVISCATLFYLSLHSDVAKKIKFCEYILCIE